VRVRVQGAKLKRMMMLMLPSLAVWKGLQTNSGVTVMMLVMEDHGLAEVPAVQQVVTVSVMVTAALFYRWLQVYQNLCLSAPPLYRRRAAYRLAPHESHPVVKVVVVVVVVVEEALSFPRRRTVTMLSV
jgi:hypothetical protein